VDDSASFTGKAYCLDGSHTAALTGIAGTAATTNLVQQQGIEELDGWQVPTRCDGNGSSGHDDLGFCDTFWDELGEVILDVAANGLVKIDVICLLAIDTTFFNYSCLRSFSCRNRNPAVNWEPTLDETSTGPFNLCRNDHSTRYVTRPHDARPRLDRKHVPTRDFRRPRRSQSRNVIIKVAVHDLVAELAFRLPRSDGGVEGLNVGHVAGEQFGIPATVG